MLEPSAIKSTVEKIRQLTNKPFNINLFIINDHPKHDWDKLDIEKLQKLHTSLNLPPLELPTKFAPKFSEQFDVLLQLRPEIASFTFGILNKQQITNLHEQGCFVIGTATTVQEALAWEAIGADAICLQGVEAGGHRGMFLKSEDRGMALLPLLIETKAKVKLPLIAAGGIMTGQTIAALQSIGADMVQLGTAFLFCDEANLSPAYRNKLLSSSGHDTKLTQTFSGKLARGIENQFMRELANNETVPIYPIQNALSGPIRKWAKEQNNAEFMSLWAGQGVGMGRPLSMQKLVSTLVDEWYKSKSI